MGIAKEYAEKQKNKKFSAKAYAEKIDKYNSTDYSMVNQAYIDSFLKDADSYFNTAESDYGALNWGNATNSYNKRNQTWSDLTKRADAVGAWLYHNRNSLNDDAYNYYNNYLDSIYESGRGIVDSFKNYSDYFKQWTTQKDYDLWKADEDEYARVRALPGFSKYIDSKFQKNYEAQIGMDILGTKGGFAGVNAMGDRNVNIERIKKYLTPEDLAIYYYYLEKEPEKAEAYYNKISDQATYESAKSKSKLYNQTGIELLNSLAAGVESFSAGMQNVGNAVNGALWGTENETIQPSVSQYAFDMMRQDNDGLWFVANDLAQTIGNQLPSMALNAAIPGAGVVTMGVSAAGNAYSEMKKVEGVSETQAIAYGVTIGVLEATLQKFIGGISGLGSDGGIVQNAVKKALPNITNGFARAVVSLGANMADEGIEEAAQTALEPLVQWITSGKIPSQFTSTDDFLNHIGDIAYSGFLGALSAGVLEGGTDTINTLQLNSQYSKAYSKNPEALKALLESIAMETPDLDISKVQNRVDAGKNVSGNMIRELAYQNELANWNKDYNKVVSATESRLNELGEQGNVKKLAESIARAQFGDFGSAIENAENVVRDTKDANADTLAYAMANYRGDVKDLSRTDKRNIRESEYGSRVSNELNPNMRDETSSAWAQGVKTNRLGNTAENVAKTRAVLTQLNEASKSRKKLPSDAISYKSGVVDASLTPKGKDAKIEGENKSVSETYARAEGYKGLANETFSKYYKGENIEEYALGFREAYDYGLNGTVKDVKDLSNHGSFKSYINEEAREMAFNAGVVDAKYMGIKSKTIKVDGDYKVTVPMSNKALSESKQATIELMKVLAPIAKVNMSTMVSLKDHGLYDPKTNTIYIDLAMDGRDVMIFTLSHELTHHLKRVNPEQFDEFARALFEEVGKTENVEERIAKWMRENKKYYPNMDQTKFKVLAREEVVAEMCESFLTDERVVQRISQKVYETDKGLWNTIKKWFEDLVAKLKKLFADLDPQSENGRIVREMGDRLDSVRQMWADMVVEAGDIATELGIEIDVKSESISPTLIHSRKTWKESDYVLNRDIMAEKIASALNVSERKAKKYIDDINSIARIISNDRARLDYQASSFGSAFVSNVEYGGSFDYTTLCKKRRIYTGTFSEIQKRLHDVALTPDDILKIRNLMIEQGIEATCGLCYVEGSRANMGKFAQKFIELYKRDNPNAWIPTMADVNTPDGVEQMRINHPEVYESYEYFWNHYGKLKESDPALFASQQKPKLYEARKEYKGEILTHFKGESAIGKKNLNGGIRMQSFSDFEIVHLIDTMQVIMDMSTVGLAGQAYTKVPEFALAFGDTGLKINLSLIAKGVNENGELIFDDREGMPHETAFDIRNKYSKNVGTIIVTFTDEQLMAAMADDRIDFIIPFHRSQWKKGQYGAMGLPRGTKDYTFMQNEKLIKQTYHEYQGRMVKDKATNYMPNEYWNFSKSGKENAEKYLKMCAENNKRPKFYKLLDYDGNGTYSLKKDGSTDGYWKLLIDFKMYDNNGKGSPQTPVIPRFNMEESTKMLDEYKGGHEKYPIAYDVVDKFVEQYNDDNHTRHSHKTVDPITSREELAKALSKVAKGEDRAIVGSYKANVNLIKGETARLESLRKEIDEIKYKKSITYEGRELSVKEFEQIAYTRAEEMGIDAEKVKFKALKESGKYIATADGKKILEAEKRFRSKDDIDKLATLEQNYQATIKRITTYDKKLLQIEAMSSIKQLINREKKASYDKAKAEGKEALKEYKAQAIAEQKKITERYQEMRKKNVEGRKTTEMRHKLMNTVHTLDQLLVNPTKKKHIPIGLQKPVAEALNILNTDTVGAEERLAKITAELKTTDDPFEINRLLESYNRIKAQGDKIKEKIDSLKSAYAEILNSEDDIIRNSYDEVIANTIEQVSSKIGDTAVRDMTYDQLEMLYKMYRMILKTIRDANKSFTMAKGEEISTLGQNVMSEVAQYERKDKAVLPLFEKGLQFTWNNLKPVYAFERIGSSTLAELYNNVRRGEDVWAVDMQEARAYSDAQKAKYGYKSWDMEKTYTFHTPLGKEFKLNLGQIMSIYAYTRRGEQAIEHLINGGFVYDGVTIVEKKIGDKIKVDAELKDSTAYRLDEAVIGQINATLTKDQREFAEAMQKYLSETMGEKGNEVSLALYDIKIFGEKNYFPLKSSQVFLERAREQARGEVKIKNKGFTKETTPRANNPITLTSFMDVWADHCIEMSMYHAFTLPLEDFYRVYNYKERATDEKDTESVIMNLENAYGKSVTSYIDQLLVDLNGGLRTDPRAGILGGTIAAFKKASTMASLSVVVQQPSSIIRAMSMVDAKYFIDKSSKYTHKQTWEEVKKYAPVAVIKEMGYFDVGLGKTSQEWLKNDPTKYEQFEEKWLTRAPALADEMGWNILWKAIKRETVAKHPELKFNSEEFLNECGRRFTEVVSMTQVYDSVFSRSANMRSKDTGMKMLTSFMAESTTISNMFEDAMLKARRGNKKVLGKTIGAIVFSSLVNAIAVSFVYAARDDDDEEYWNKYLKKFVDNFGSNIIPVAWIPIGRDFMSLIEGYDIERADMALLSDLVKAIRRLSSTRVEAEEKIADIIGAIANLFGIPLKNLYRDFVEPIWRHFTK